MTGTDAKTVEQADDTPARKAANSNTKKRSLAERSQAALDEICAEIIAPNAKPGLVFKKKCDEASKLTGLNIEAMQEALYAAGKQAGLRPKLIRNRIGSAFHHRFEKYDQDILKEFIGRFVYIVSTEKVADLKLPSSAKPLMLRSWRSAHKNALVVDEDDKPRAVTSIWESNTQRIEVHATQYRPDEDRIFTDPEDGLRYLNEYENPKWKTGRELDPDNDFPPDVVMELLRLLAPDDRDLDWLVRWMAFTTHHPEKRPAISPLLISRHHGIGKGLFTQLMGKLVGESNKGLANMSSLIKGTNPEAGSTTLCVVDEVAEGTSNKSRFTAMDSIRHLLSETEVPMKRLYEDVRKVKTFTNYIFLTNHEDAIKIEKLDRRLLVINSHAEPREQEFYRRLVEIIDDPEAIAQIAGWLLLWKDRPLDDRAPDTDGKDAAVNASVEDWELDVENFVDWYFLPECERKAEKDDLPPGALCEDRNPVGLRLAEIIDYLCDLYPARLPYSEMQVKRPLKRMGYRSKRTEKDGVRASIWIKDA